MHDSVRNAFVGYSTPLEGCIPHLYSDIKGLVTIAIGNLVDPVGTALSLPMLHADGSRASREDILADWTRIKSDPKCATLGYRYAARIAQLHLDDAGIAQVVGAKLDLFDRQMTQRFPSWETFPADAQLGVLSLCWACGASFRFPRLTRGILAREWASCAVESQMSTAGNPGLIPRNARHMVLFGNAYRVDRNGLDPDQLYWPRDLAAETPDAA